MKTDRKFETKDREFNNTYTLGHKLDNSIGFMDTVNIERLLKEDYSTALVLMYEAVKQERILEPALAKVINKNADSISKVNVYFITDWIRAVLTLGKPIHDMFMQCSELVGKMFPDLKTCIGFDIHSEHHKHTVYEHMLYVTDKCDTTKFEIKLAALFHDVGKPNVFTLVNGAGRTFGHPRESAEIARRAFDFYIKLSKDENTYITELIMLHDKFIVPTDRSIRKVLKQYGSGFLDDYCVLKKADMLDHINVGGVWKNYDVDKLRKRVHELDIANKTLTINNINIDASSICSEIGVDESTANNIMQVLLDCVISGQVKNKRQDLLSMAGSIYCKLKSVKKIK